MDLAHMLNSIRLNLAISQIQGGVGLARMLDSMRLNLAVSQVQNGVGLASILLDLVVSQT
jgi:hypothetical protein